MKHAEMSNAELAFRLRKLGRHAPQWLAVVADRLEGMPADPVPVPQGEPVAWKYEREDTNHPLIASFRCVNMIADGWRETPLYAATEQGEG